MADSSYVYLINPTFQFMNVSGKPLTDGYINLYISGTRSKYYAFSDFEGTLHPFNIPLNSLGSAVVLVSPAHSYDVYVYNSLGTLQMSRYNITPATGEGTVITDVTTLTSDDNTVDISVNSSTEYDLSIANQISSLKSYADQAESDAVLTSKSYTDTSISNKKDKQTAIDVSGSETKTITRVQQNENGVITVTFSDIDLPNDVNITSNDSSVSITDDGNGNFDLSVNFPSNSQTYGVFSSSNGSTWNKVSGNIDSIVTLDDANYHYTVIVPYSVATLSNVIDQISLTGGTLTDKRDIDLSYGHNGIVEFSADKKMTSFAPVLTMPTGSSIYPVAYLFIHSIGGTSSGSGNNDKVAVDENATAGYLEDVLVSDSDLVSLVKSGNTLHVQVNTQYSADPKLSTCDESVINSATSNYGSYELKAGYNKLIWNDTNHESFSYLNAIVYQMNRLCTSQGTITKVNLALCGTLSFQSPAPWLNIGVFATDGTLLGQTGLKYYGTDFNSDEELISFDMVEETTGALNLARNTHYIVQVVHCGLQLAGLDRTDSYNYNYDVNLRQNLQGTISQPVFPSISNLTSIITCIPYVTFGAAVLN